MVLLGKTYKLFYKYTVHMNTASLQYASFYGLKSIEDSSPDENIFRTDTFLYSYP